MPRTTILEGEVGTGRDPATGNVIISVTVSPFERFTLSLDPVGAAVFMRGFQEAMQRPGPTVQQAAKPEIVVPGVRVPA